MEPILASIINRPKPKLPDKYITAYDYMIFINDLACWKADQAEKYLSGVKED